MKKYNVIDLFSGMGGFSKGFENAGFNIVEAIEFDEKIAEIYKNNFEHPVFMGDIKNYSYDGKEEIDVVIGGPPCQGFSLAGNPGRTFIDDPRNELYKEFVRVVDEVKPKVFIMENVAKMATHNKGGTILQILNDFKNIGYNVEYKVLNSVDYLVPQNRRRTIIFGSLSNKLFSWPQKKSKKINIKSAIDDLPNLSNGEVSGIDGHFSMNHSQDMLHKMSFISDAGDRKQIPLEIRPTSGDARKYIKYDSNKPSVTVTGDMRKIFHYSQNRALSPRELMRLQTFPDDFVLGGAKSIISQQAIGNSVPVYLANEIANQIRKYLSNNNKSFPKINYIGNKKKIAKEVANEIKGDILADVFGGSGAISWEAKLKGKKVHINDALFSNFSLHKALIENNSQIKFSFELGGAEYLKEHQDILGKHFFSNEILEFSKLFSNISKKKSYSKYFGYSLLRRSMIRKMPYSRFNVPWNQIKMLRDEDYSYEKYGRKRSYHNDSFIHHIIENISNFNNGIISGEARAYWLDAFDFVKKFNNINPTDVYLDPPYPGTMNNYSSFYSTIDHSLMKESKFKTDFTKDFDNIFIKLILNCFKYNSVKRVHISLSEKNIDNILKIKDKLKSNFAFNIKEWKHDYKLTSKNNKSNKELLVTIKKK